MGENNWRLPLRLLLPGSIVLLRCDCTASCTAGSHASLRAACNLLQGEDICMALQTHINDIMMKRYSKAKAMAGARSGLGGTVYWPAHAHTVKSSLFY